MEFIGQPQYLGIDWGQSKIGLALGSPNTKLASPYKVVSSIDEVIAVVKQENVEKIIVGEPIQLTNDAQMKQAFRQFNQQLHQLGLPVELIDERLTTKQAGRLGRDKKQSAQEDAIAAMLILQSYFDRL